MKARRTLRIGLVVASVLFLATAGCKREPERPEERGVSWEDITVGYPDVEGQRQRMEKFSQVLDDENAIGKPDEALRQMVERVPLVYVETHLKELAKEPSAKAKPNIDLLLSRIKEIRSLDEDGAVEFVRKGKESGNCDGLCVAVFSLRTESLRTKAADALASVGDSKAVRVLTIKTFGAAATPLGGSEAQVMREQFRRSLVSALASCTRLDFSDYDASSEMATLEVVKECQDWLEKTGR